MKSHQAQRAALHCLKNDQILPAFWQVRSRDIETSWDVCFLDLEELKNELRIGKTHTALSDSVLEAVLYGSPQVPHYSGWTKDRLTHACEKSGFESPRSYQHIGSVAQVALKPKSWTHREQRQARKDQISALVWQKRKNLRAMAQEIKGKFRNLVSPVCIDSADLSLNLGAGSEKHEGYLRVDHAGDQDVYDNIIGLGRFSDNTVKRIYSNHVLEHIPQNLIPQMLQNWFRVLKTGAVVTARMPDARRAVLCLNEMWEEVSDQELKRYDLPPLLDKESERQGRLRSNDCIQLIYGWSDSTPFSWDLSNQHKSLWTPSLTKKRFEAAGFKVEVCENFGTLNTLIVARKIN